MNNYIKSCCAVLAVMTMPHLHAADYFWSGSGENEWWSNSANWGGGAAPVGGSNVLHFNTLAGEIASNDVLTSLNGIIFGKNAGSFTLNSSSSIDLVSAGLLVRNESAATHTINANLRTTAQNVYFDIRDGSLVLNGALSASQPYWAVNKDGGGVLEFNGANNFGGPLYHRQGTVRVNVATGLLSGGNVLSFGDPTLRTGNSAHLEFLGGAYNMTSIQVATHAAHQVTVTGGRLKIGTFTNSGFASTNFNLSDPAASLEITTTSGLQGTTPRIEGATVTQGGKTGFARIDANIVTRLATFSDLTAVPSYSPGEHARVGGSETLATYRTVNSLTIQGAGTLSGHDLLAREILMEEGVAGYTLNNSVIAPQVVSHALRIHQHSLAGELVIAGKIFQAGGTGTLSTAGPGITRITGGNNNSTGATYVQQGTLIIDGALTHTSAVTVYDGATLSGAGAIGSAANTSITIRSGGTLAATTEAALSVGGALAFERDASFSMAIGGLGEESLSVSNSVAFGSDINLILSLTSAPVSGASYTLLESGSISGGFSSINGLEIGLDGLFTLNFGSDIYQFELFQTGTEIRVAAIPEPSSLMLLSGIGLASLILRRKRR